MNFSVLLSLKFCFHANELFLWSPEACFLDVLLYVHVLASGITRFLLKIVICLQQHGAIIRAAQSLKREPLSRPFVLGNMAIIVATKRVSEGIDARCNGSCACMCVSPSKAELSGPHGVA